MEVPRSIESEIRDLVQDFVRRLHAAFTSEALRRLGVPEGEALIEEADEPELDDAIEPVPADTAPMSDDARIVAFVAAQQDSGVRVTTNQIAEALGFDVDELRNLVAQLVRAGRLAIESGDGSLPTLVTPR